MVVRATSKATSDDSYNPLVQLNFKKYKPENKQIQFEY
jgi:hypothetical protein